MKLIIEDDEGHRTIIPFARDELTIGRHEENVVRLTEKNVSRKHGRLLREDGRFFVEDLKSLTGIRVNGEKIVGKRLVREGDLIQIGESDLSLQAGPEEQAVLPGSPRLADGKVNQPTHISEKTPAPVPPKPEAVAEMPPGGGSRLQSRPLVLGLCAALVVALGAAAFFATRHHRAHVSGADGHGDDGDVVTRDSMGQRKFALRAAEEGVATHRYTEAVRHLEAARRAGATAAELRDSNLVQAESLSEELYRELEGAMAAQDYERARRLLSALSGSHTYFGNQAEGKTDAVTSGYVTLHLAAAGLLKDKDNAGCLAEARLALQANPRSRDAQSLVETCKLASDRPATVRTSSPVSRPAPVSTPHPALDDHESQRH